MKGRLTAKERVKIPRQRMPEQEPQSRRHNFQEVNLGLAANLAATEASRCIACADPKCVNGCPVGVKVREFVEWLPKRLDQYRKSILTNSILVARSRDVAAYDTAQALEWGVTGVGLRATESANDLPGINSTVATSPPFTNDATLFAASP